MILVGNKVDRANEREVSKEEAQTLARRLGCDLSTLRFFLQWLPLTNAISSRNIGENTSQSGNGVLVSHLLLAKIQRLPD